MFPNSFINILFQALWQSEVCPALKHYVWNAPLLFELSCSISFLNQSCQKDTYAPDVHAERFISMIYCFHFNALNIASIEYICSLTDYFRQDFIVYLLRT